MIVFGAELQTKKKNAELVDRWRNDDVLANGPVDRSHNTLFVGSLQRVDDSQHLGTVSTARSWVGEGESDLFGRVDHKHRSDGLDNASVQVLETFLVNHVEEVGNFSGLVTNDRVGERLVVQSNLLDVLDPGVVLVNTLGRQTNQLDVSSVELWLQLGESTQLGGANWSEVGWVGEKNNPRVANELVEVDFTSGGWSLEVWHGGTNSQSWLRGGVESDESLEREGRSSGESGKLSGEHDIY
ncbi:hypothetical protein OGAPHI_002714 [Ogataea philodendri]|uniref:Uncharacterized protein n=1 Tax=Ogataea philodendri TaxID=1378263 RepID=A0A9P8T7Y8_9ASCO|nr:uncharacterized protein OGAPHI_002714 [Ogataea philodendri]KAH3668959.1 hypothetical protein OGAPHI_002714 [Ogataea philodendri]